MKTVNGATIYMRDVAHVRDGFSPQTNIVRQDGGRSALLSVYKTGSASTLAIVHDVRAALSTMAAGLPPELKITPLFDQSIFVRAAVQGVLREALTAACLTAAMILLFLGNWRSTLIIAISIPLAILVSVICLSALGETMNLMTLGGLALAVGILVDDATVEIENIERNRLLGKELREAILHGAQEIAVPAFVSTLCICIVFVPMFFLSGVTRFLFVPLAEAVIFAMLASYLLSRTLVPTMVMFLLRNHNFARSSLARLDASTSDLKMPSSGCATATGTRSRLVMRHGRWFAAAFLALCLASLGFVFVLGQDLFPQVDAGLMRLHVRARTGLRIEETARLTDEIENTIRTMIPAGELDTMLDNIGLPYSGINLSYSNAGTIGTPDAEILVSLKEEPPANQRVREAAAGGIATAISGHSILLPAGRHRHADSQFRRARADRRTDRRQRPTGQLQRGPAIGQPDSRHPGAVDVHVQQAYDAPTLHLDVDRTFAQSVGLSQRDVASNLLVSLSSSFQTAPTFWLNPQNGISYNVAVQTPQYRVDSVKALLDTPIRTAGFARTADPGQPGVVSPCEPARRDFPLQRAAAGGRVRFGAGPRSGRRGERCPPRHRAARKTASARQPSDHHRPGIHHVAVVHRAGRRRRHGHRARLSVDRGEFPIVARPVHHHHRVARRIGRNHLGLAADSHHPECAIAHRRHHVRGRGHRQQHSDGLLRP